MKMKIKRNIIVYSIIAALFIVPLVVFAVVYTSNVRTNNFAPGSVDIIVHEGAGSDNEGETLQKGDYTWKASGSSGAYYSEKSVQIKDIRTNPEEVLRVQFIPMWFEKKSGSGTDVYNAVFNFGNFNLNGDTLVYTDNDKTITLRLASGWNTSGWSYSDPNATPPGDGFFYYTGSLDSNKLTPQLLESVGLNDKAYELTKNYDFRLDVLADAVQKDHQNSSGTASPRW